MTGRARSFRCGFAGVAVIAGLLLSPAIIRAGDWPQWRGPNRDGIVPKADVPAKWPDELKKAWQRPVGVGHSSPIVVNDIVYQHSRQGDDEVVQAFRLKDGEPIWRKQYSAPYEMDSAAVDHGKGPKSTPACHEGRLYTLGINGRLTCWEVARGDILWQHDFGRDYAKPSPQFGTATSPLIVDGMCIVHGGGQEGGALTAFDAKSGKPQWSLKGVGPGYASPIVATFDKVRQLVTQTQDACISVDLKSGRELWKIPFTTDYEQNSITPVLAGELVLFAGYHQPTFAVAPRRDGNRWTTPRVWANAEIPLFMSTPVVDQKHFFGMTQKRSGQLFCAEVASGRVLWSSDGRFGENASLLIAGDKVLALSTEAKLLVMEKKFRELKITRTYQVGETPTWASPALSGSSILIKDLESLTCFSLTP